MQECGECTLCCKLLETHGIYSPIGEYCKNCNPEKGCTIYEYRPKECRDYQCMWSQAPRVGKELRPDRCNIIFDKISDKTIVGAQVPFTKITPIISGQIDAFNREGFSVFISCGNRKDMFLAPYHKHEDIYKEINDSSILHRRSN